MIKRLLENEYVTPSQARAIETFVYGLFFSLVIGIIDNVLLILQGEVVSWRGFFLGFLLTASTATMMGIKKYLRDKQTEIDLPQ